MSNLGIPAHQLEVVIFTAIINMSPRDCESLGRARTIPDHAYNW